MDTDSLRLSYKPDHIRILLVGESPPANGGFFYDRSLMTTFTARAFEEVYGTKFEDTLSFLMFFKSKNCYLYDISSLPVDKMAGSERRKILNDCVDDFSKRLREHKPEAIVAVLKRISLYVETTMYQANIKCPYYVLPFPGMGHQNKYMKQLVGIIEKHLEGL